MIKKIFALIGIATLVVGTYFFIAMDNKRAEESKIYKNLNLNNIKFQSTKGKEAISKCISKEYGINLGIIQSIVELSDQAAIKYKTDYLLILAIIAIESRFHPLLQSEAGALGLMQIMPKIHSSKLEPHGGANATFDPRVNIDIGTSILTTFIKQTGSMERGLAKYVGAGSDLNHIYITQVLSEYKKNQDCILYAN